MSSHHIVRDNQEPALIVHELSPYLVDRMLELFEWSPVVMCYESEAEKMQSMGHKVDVLLSPSDRIRESIDLLNPQVPENIRYDNRGNFLSPALAYLIDKGHKTVNLISAGLPANHIIGLIPPGCQLELTLLNQWGRNMLFHKNKYCKWLSGATPIELILPNISALVWTRGFVRNLSGQLSKSNIFLSVEREGIVVIETNQPPLIIAERW